MSETHNPCKHRMDEASASPAIMPDPGGLEYKIYSDFTEIGRLARQWEKLLAMSQCNKAFASLEWYLASCRMDSSGAPYVIVAIKDAEVICILPLLLTPGVGAAMFPDYGSDYNDILVQGDNPVVAADVLRYALSAETRCRHLKLSKLRPDSNCLAALHLLKDDLNIEYRHNIIDSHFYAELPADFEDYLASLSYSFRQYVRKAFRRANGGGLRVCEIYPRNVEPVELPDLYFRLFMCRHSHIPLCEQIKAQSFLRETLPPMFRKGSLRVFVVIEEECIIAALLVFVCGKGFLTWGTGFLAEKEQWSPGSMLYAFAIKQAIALGLRECDFGDGDEAYKRHWTKREYKVSEVELIAKC